MLAKFTIKEGSEAKLRKGLRKIVWEGMGPLGWLANYALKSVFKKLKGQHYTLELSFMPLKLDAENKRFERFTLHLDNYGFRADYIEDTNPLGPSNN